MSWAHYIPHSQRPTYEIYTQIVSTGTLICGAIRLNKTEQTANYSVCVLYYKCGFFLLLSFDSFHSLVVVWFVRLPIRNKSIENVESTEVLLRQAGDGSVVCLCVVSVYCENWMKFVFSFVCACTVTQRNIRAKTESHQYKIINGWQTTFTSSVVMILKVN